MIRIESNQPTKRNNAQLMFATATGAALGMGSRYLVPTKAEMRSLKSSADTFFSNTATAARGANRSMLKYGAVGALAAAAITLLTKLLGAKQEQKQEQADTFEYSKLQALIDAPEYACEILLYED
ncbi:MAG: hypothetical protein IJB79_08670 [Candidatus Gastranaerophilales bacterium]|nr:hypothetical protein [Candidatus Gastranaerophilales bacterium]